MSISFYPEIREDTLTIECCDRVVNFSVFVWARIICGISLKFAQVTYRTYAQNRKIQKSHKLSWNDFLICNKNYTVQRHIHSAHFVMFKILLMLAEVLWLWIFHDVVKKCENLRKSFLDISQFVTKTPKFDIRHTKSFVKASPKPIFEFVFAASKQRT